MRHIPAVLLATLGALACASGPEVVQDSGSRRVEFSCSRYSPSMQTAVLEAVVAGGGPGRVSAAGWMCGRLASGYVRIVLLEYTPDDARLAPFLEPVVFVDGALVAFGWHLLEVQPDRYGVGTLPDRSAPWRTPEGWSSRRYPGTAGASPTNR